MGERKPHTNWDLELTDLKAILKQKGNDPHYLIPYSANMTQVCVHNDEHAPMKVGRFLMRVNPSEADSNAPPRKWQCRDWKKKGEFDMRRMTGTNLEKESLEARQIRLEAGNQEWMGIVVKGPPTGPEPNMHSPGEEDFTDFFEDALNSSVEVHDHVVEEDDMATNVQRFLSQDIGISREGKFQLANVKQWATAFPDLHTKNGAALDMEQFVCLLFQSLKVLQKRVQVLENQKTGGGGASIPDDLDWDSIPLDLDSIPADNLFSNSE